MECKRILWCCAARIRYDDTRNCCLVVRSSKTRISHRGWTDGTEHRIKCLQVQQKDKKKRKNCENGKELKQSIASHWTVINKSCVQMAMNLCSIYIYIFLWPVLLFYRQTLCCRVSHQFRHSTSLSLSRFNIDNAMQLTALFHLVCNLHFYSLVQHPIACARCCTCNQQQYGNHFIQFIVKFFSRSHSTDRYLLHGSIPKHSTIPRRTLFVKVILLNWNVSISKFIRIRCVFC